MKPIGKVRLMGDELHWVATREGHRQCDWWEPASLSNVHEVIQQFIALTEESDKKYLRFAKQYGCLGLQLRQSTTLPAGDLLTIEKLSEWQRYTRILHIISELHAQVLKNELLSIERLIELADACRISHQEKITIESDPKRRRTVNELQHATELHHREFLASVIDGLLNKLNLKPQFQYAGIAGKSELASRDPNLYDTIKHVPSLHGRLCLNYSYTTGLLDVLVSNFIADLCSVERFKVCEYPSCSEKIPFNGNTRYCSQHKLMAKAEKHREQQRRWKAKQQMK